MNRDLKELTVQIFIEITRDGDEQMLALIGAGDTTDLMLLKYREVEGKDK